ncbi:MAG TPA: carbamate kinase [Candidatus Lumbricidophila sp.]|nr:carbamate kinase [Candidatus Lumbricidophila sp.]
MRIVIALGGNALLRRDEAPDADTQTARLALAAPTLAQLAQQHQVVLVHGNGPQIGLLARESTDDRSLTSPYPLTALGAETQGLIGSLIQQSLHNAGLSKPAVTLITHTIVDADDPALSNPTKFIGAVYSRRKAARLARDHGWRIAPDWNGWRRVVASPQPRRIVELEAARTLLTAGVTVVMGGGGGVPLTEDRGYHPADAVIDKDHTAALIATELAADLLIILTDVPGVLSDYGTPDQSVIESSTPALLRLLSLPEGSMGPKVDAVCTFTELTGKRAAIGALEDADAVVRGTAGTQVQAGSTLTSSGGGDTPAAQPSAPKTATTRRFAR